jgi:hypothetical protein
MVMSPAGQTEGRLRWRVPAATVNYRLVLSSERLPHNKKTQVPEGNFDGERKIGHRPQIVA